MEWVAVEIVNWTRYNPRSDRSGHTWFRLENNIAGEPKFFGLTAAQKFAVICVFAEVSKNQGRTTWINLDMLEAQLELKSSEIFKAICLLRDTGVIKVPSGDHPVTGRLHTYGRTDVRTNEIPSAEANESLPSASEELHPESLRDPGTEEFLSKVKPSVSQSWVKAYDPEWVKHEIKKATVWLKANPARAPKQHYGRFMSNWLSRGWDRHRKTLSPTRINTTPIALESL